MDTDALRWFQHVVEGVTVTEVGAIFGVPQSGVSRALARLEAEVGTPLLGRSGRLLKPTLAGTAFKRHVDALLNDLDDGLASVAEVIDPDRGTVALAFQLSIGTWLVPFLVGGFRTHHPGVRFALRQARDEVVNEVLAGGRVDLEITTLRPTDPRITWHRLFSEPLCLALPPGHPLAGPREVDLADVAGEPFVALRPASQLRRLGMEACRRAGFEPDVPFEGDDLPTVRGFVAAGLGVAVVPGARDGTPEAVGPVAHVRLSDAAARREIGLAWLRDRRLLPAAEIFRRHVVEHARRGEIPPVAG